MNCSNCGAYLGEADAFCGECGQPVVRQAQAGPSPEDVRDQETELLPSMPPSVAAAPPARPPARVSSRRWPLIAGLAAAGLGLCICVAALAMLLLAQTAGTPTAVVELPAPTVVAASATTVELPAGASLYEENFDAPGGWDEYDDEDTWAAYAGGGYRLGIRRADYVTWGNPEDLPGFSDFSIEVDARQVEGPLDNNLGVLVRYQSDDDNFYWFQISSDGYFAIDLMQAGEWVTLVSWEASTAIRQGLDVVNRLRVECEGSQFAFAVNGTDLATITDATLSTGSIGLAAGTFGEPGVVVEFDNLVVRELQ